MKLNPRVLEKITDLKLEHYNLETAVTAYIMLNIRMDIGFAVFA